MLLTRIVITKDNVFRFLEPKAHIVFFPLFLCHNLDMIVVIIEGGNRTTNTQDIKQLVALESCIKIIKVEEVRINNKKVKLIYVLNSKTRVGCPKCNKYTYWIDNLR